MIKNWHRRMKTHSFQLSSFRGWIRPSGKVSFVATNQKYTSHILSFKNDFAFNKAIILCLKITNFKVMQIFDRNNNFSTKLQPVTTSIRPFLKKTKQKCNIRGQNCSSCSAKKLIDRNINCCSVGFMRTGLRQYKCKWQIW